ncbi:MAG: MarR family transcriptional regulator [Candidatus Marinimicrobia bacterium]|nr:MarR family transcriptional regulator [Candidatus Neomarinimicrobiota bacterium]
MSTHYNGNETEKRVLDTWIKLNRAYNSIGQHLRRNMEDQGITMTQFGVLEILKHLGPLPLKVIGEKILLSSSNMVTVVDNLEKSGLVVRNKNPQDRRSILVTLTSEGKQTIGPVFQNHLIKLLEAFSVLEVEEQIKLGDLCKKLGVNQKYKEI